MTYSKNDLLMYNIQFEKAAKNSLIQLFKRDYNRIIKKILLLSHNPRPKGCVKLKTSDNDWRIRIGNWRVIYEINDTMKIVRVLKIALRKDVYRN